MNNELNDSIPELQFQCPGTNQTISHTTMLQKGEMGHKLPSGHLHPVLWGAVHGRNSSRTLCRHETDDGQQHRAD